MKKLLTILVPALLLSSFLIKGHSISEILVKINRYFNERPMEKIFLHMDKPYYTSGDDLWYSAYLVDYNSNSFSKLSEILHVEIFDKNGNSVIHQKKPIVNGLANGVIKIPSLNPDYYLVKAYTNWSRNFGDDLNFNYYMKVVSPSYNNDDNSIETVINFYPEGGKIIANKLNQVLFTSNLKRASTSYLMASEKDTIAKIAYNGKGFGKFRIVPKSINEKFHLTFEGINNRFSLPDIDESGVSLTLSEKESYYDLTLHGSADLSGNTFSFILMHKGNVVSAQEGIFKNAGNLLRLPKSSMPGGLHHILVIDEKLNVLSQRLIYNEVQNPDQIQVSGNSTFNLGDDVELKLSQEGQSRSHLSVGVTPYKYFGDSDKPAINYDFNFNNSETGKISINDKLISEKLETYDFTEILNGSSPTFQYPIEKQDLMAINVTLDQLNESISPNYSISLKSKDSIDFYFAQIKDDNLTFAVPAFNGRRDLIVKPHLWSGVQPKYTLQNSYPSNSFEKEFMQTPEETAYARYSRENNVIGRFYNSSYKKKTDNYEAPLTFSILRSFDKEINLKEYIVLPDMMTVIKELLEGVRVRKNNNGEDMIRMFSVDQETGYFKKPHEDQPLMLIDGLPIYNSKYILNLNPLEVKKISLSYAEGILNGVNYDGVLSIETEEGHYGKIQKLGQGVFAINGYAGNYEFKIPKRLSNDPDFRSTYYWNPHVELTSDHPVTLTFPTSYDPGKYLVDIQGINEDGSIIAQKFIFEVR